MRSEASTFAFGPLGQPRFSHLFAELQSFGEPCRTVGCAEQRSDFLGVDRLANLSAFLFSRPPMAAR